MEYAPKWKTHLTKEEVDQLADDWYKGKSTREIVEFQLYEPRLCMPFFDFQQAVEAELGRPVQTIEFGPCLGSLQHDFEENKIDPEVM